MRIGRRFPGLALAWILVAAVPLAAQPVSTRDRLFISKRGQSEETASPLQDSAWATAEKSFAARASEDGSVSVIVELTLPKKLSPEQIAWNSRIAVAQAEMVASAVRDFHAATRDLVSHESVKTFDALPFVQLQANEAVIRRLFDLPFVESIGEEGVGRPLLNDTIPQINSTDAYNVGATGSGQVIAVIDTGVDTSNPFFTGKIAAQACFSTPDPGGQTLCANGVNGSTGTGAGNNCTVPLSSNTECFHGTSMAGVAMGTSTSGVGPGGATLRGVAASAKLIPVMTFSQSNQASVCSGAGLAPPCYLHRESDIVSALNFVYSRRNSFKIASVNMSLGLNVLSSSYSSGTCDANWPLSVAAVNQLVAASIAVVAATGNSGNVSGFQGKIAPPACFSQATAVAAIQKPAEGGGFAPYANASAQVALLAPGGNCAGSIYSTDPNCGIDSALPAYLGQGNFGNHLLINGSPAPLTGTSQAAAHVSGAIAAFRTLYPFASPAAIVGQFQNTGTAISITQGTFSGQKKSIVLANPATHQIITPAAPSVPTSVSVRSEHCQGLNDVLWSAPVSGTVTEYHVATSPSSSPFTPTLVYSGTTSPWTINVSSTLYAGVQACNLVSCSNWVVAANPATVYNGCN